MRTLNSYYFSVGLSTFTGCGKKKRRVEPTKRETYKACEKTCILPLIYDMIQYINLETYSQPDGQEIDDRKPMLCM